MPDRSRRATEIWITALHRRLILSPLLTVPLIYLTIVLVLVPGWRFPGREAVCVLIAVPVVTWAAWPFHRATPEDTDSLPGRGSAPRHMSTVNSPVVRT
ncbi:hypothetical protein [Ruania zhangjianzhongii]|uniref:hypothetical protein n=1 Tax=Ruania zhangjianzhongii TaxID=2603206 RepID=UPI00165289D0|nr:hypothetical protein [Ruania zhangjianzhongii]